MGESFETRGLFLFGTYVKVWFKSHLKSSPVSYRNTWYLFDHKSSAHDSVQRLKGMLQRNDVFQRGQCTPGHQPYPVRWRCGKSLSTSPTVTEISSRFFLLFFAAIRWRINRGLEKLKPRFGFVINSEPHTAFAATIYSFEYFSREKFTNYFKIWFK